MTVPARSSRAWASLKSPRGKQIGEDADHVMAEFRNPGREQSTARDTAINDTRFHE
jgi:hypothetical protein